MATFECECMNRIFSSPKNKNFIESLKCPLCGTLFEKISRPFTDFIEVIAISEPTPDSYDVIIGKTETFIVDKKTLDTL